MMMIILRMPKQMHLNDLQSNGWLDLHQHLTEYTSYLPLSLSIKIEKFLFLMFFIELIFLQNYNFLLDFVLSLSTCVLKPH